MRRVLTLVALAIGATMSPIDRFITEAKAAGCPPDQLRNFMRARLVLTPQQLKAAAAARLCDLEGGPTDVGYGGARGGGKSYFSLGQLAADDCQRYPGLKVLYLRKVGKAGKEAVQDLRRSVLHSIPHEYKSQDNKIVFPNGSIIILGHFQADKDIDTYLGLEYDVILVEESTQLTARKVRDIATCCRTSKPGWRPRLYYTTNPGNVGHGWFKEKFIAPLRAGNETSTRFIQATVRDNPFVNPEYRKQLEQLTGWQRRAWLDGSWDIAAGQYFTGFRREHVCRELAEIPRDWRVWSSFDYGFVHYTASYLIAQDGDGNVWYVDEHCERGWLPEDNAAGIIEMYGKHDVEVSDLEGIFAGHDMFSKGERGENKAATYKELGLPLKKANINRKQGAAQFIRRFGDPDGPSGRQPTVFITPDCPRLLDCIPLLQHNPSDPEDVLKVDADEDGIGGDDPYDSARYGLMHAKVKLGKAGREFYGEVA